MSNGKLAELVHSLKAVSEGAYGAMHPRFHAALTAQWGLDPSRALQLVSDFVVEDPDAEQRFAAYRLWIEVLAETKDKASLRALREHLFMRGQAEPDDHETYAALRGVAHFELDEMGAARLLARSFATATHNPYGMELVQLVETRFGEGGVPALARCTARIEDYFHWQTLARGLLQAREESALAEVLEHVRLEYKGGPLPHLFEYHRCLDAGFFAGAALVAKRLTELYPESLDYRYYHAFALFEDGDYPLARRTLGETLRMHGPNGAGENDPEVVGLLGHCHAKLGDAEQAAHYLRRAVGLLKEQGLPTSHMTLELANVEDELRGDKLDPAIEMPRVSRSWLIKLSPRRYHELAQSSDSSIDRLLRPMGKDPRPGDYCFFASETPADGAGQALWKIVAIYAVDSEPMWHPTHHYHSALKLVKRLPEGIPVDVQTQGEEQGQPAVAAARGEPLHYGVYELDMGALTIIEEAARLHRDDMIERRRNGQSRRPTA
jgi:tetratricopeptide (TPR) repeat protein